MPTALFLSPHLDDAAFSAGGTAALLATHGTRVVIATAFTRSVPNPTGFALACQLDKGLDADVDYMAIRRAEDVVSCQILGAEFRHLDFPEAPHRGYDSVAELFRPPHPGDDIVAPLSIAFGSLLAEFQPELVFAPQCLGGHVDHVQLVRALLIVAAASSVTWWRDLPYAIRNSDARPIAGLPTLDVGVDIADVLAVKLEGCAAFRTQIGFQFGSAREMRTQLTQFAQFEAQTVSRGLVAERFLGVAPELPTIAPTHLGDDYAR